jgi:hypothetical protein
VRPTRNSERPEPWRGVMRQAAARLQDHPYWSKYLNGFVESRRGLHVVVLGDPSFSRVLFGIKNLEVRSLRTSRPPFESIGRGDVVLIKGRGGPISGVARVARAWMFTGLAQDDWTRLSSAASVRSDFVSDDWSFVHDSQTRLTVLTLANTCTFPVPIQYEKSDPRGWAVLKETWRPVVARRYVSPADSAALGRRRARNLKIETVKGGPS